MLMDLVPEELHDQFKGFRKDLAKFSSKKVTSCPYCHSSALYLSRPTVELYQCRACHKYCTPRTNTVYNQLIPIDWFDSILTMRIFKLSYSAIADQLDTTYEKIKRRNNVMIKDMQQRYPQLAKWYESYPKNQHEDELTQAITEQHKALKEKVTELLAKPHANCLYCQSDNTVRIGNRTGFRCKKCYKTFNIASGTSINGLPHAELWLKYIDLLVEGKSNKQISEDLNFSHNTAYSWRSRWCRVMKEWQFNALSIWCEKKY